MGVGDLDEHTPHDFWEGVHEQLQDEWASAIDLEMYWELHKSDLEPILERKLEEEGDRVEISESPVGSEPTWLLASRRPRSATLEPAERARTKASQSDPVDADTVEIDDSVIFETGADIFDSAVLRQGRDFLDSAGEEPTGPIGPEMISIMLQELEKRLTKTIEDRMECAVETRLTEFLRSKYSTPEDSERDEPPLPPRKGKKFLGEKKDLRGRIDTNLWELFHQECNKYNGNVSQTLDTILWRYFGKPKLSFEDD
jgi:hypothetical protein